MLEIEGYGIVLKPLNQSSIEQVRVWRNADKIRHNMEFRQHISAKQQWEWFLNLSNNECYYFTIHVGEKNIGLVHLNLFDKKHKSANVGLFIGDDSFVATGAALPASLLILEFAFNHLRLDTLTAKVKSSNAVAINYNSFLGFIFKDKLNPGFDCFQLSKEVFMKRKAMLEKLAANVNP